MLLEAFPRYLEEEMDLPYHLPKPGFKDKNKLDNIYIYNIQMYRKKGDDKWLDRKAFMNTKPEDKDIVEIATASLDKKRWSHPIEVQWGETQSGGGGSNDGGNNAGNSDLIEAICATLLLLVLL